MFDLYSEVKSAAIDYVFLFFVKRKPLTDSKTLSLIAMMKASLLFTTLWFVFVSFNLPIINSGTTKSGKNIKAVGIYSPSFCTPDSNEVNLVPNRQPASPGSYQINTVVIDPGHGGHDPGCSGHNSKEKHIALAVGKYLMEDIKRHYPDVNVIMTRSTDVFVPLHERASIATEQKADLFISIHCNSFSRSDVRGSETYVLGLHATEENLSVAKRENQSILLEENYRENYGFDPNSPEAHIVLSMFQNAFLEQSISFAEKVQGQANVVAGRKDRGVKQAGFLVLRYATMPSVLIETGYLTSHIDESYLMTETGQKNMAIAISNAFSSYKNEMEVRKKDVATVAYVEYKNETPVEKKPTIKVSEPVGPKEKGNIYMDDNQRKETVLAKKWGLEIGPPTESITYKKKTNTSPSKVPKILPTVPIAEKEKETVPEKVPERKPERTIEKNAGSEKPDIQFSVQLAASPKLLDVGTGKWASVKQTIEVVKEGSLFKYQVRNFATLEKAEALKSQLRSKGFSDAFVVAYKNGKRIDPRKLRN